MCELLVGLPAVTCSAIVDDAGGRCGCTSRPGRPAGVSRLSASGGGQGRGRGRAGGPAGVRAAGPAGVAQASLVCPAPACPVGSWTGEDPAIAAPRLALTDRAGRWVTEQVGRWGRTVNEVAVELGCDWHTVNDAVIAYGTALVETTPTASVSRRPWGWTRRCSSGKGRGAASVVDLDRRRRRRPAARRRRLVERRASRAAGWPPERRVAGASDRAGRRWICPGPTGRCSTRCCPTPPRSPTRSTSSSWPTASSTSAAGGCRTRRSAIGAARTIRSTGAAAC